MLLHPGRIGSREPARKVILVSLSDSSQRTLTLPFAEVGCWSFSPDGRYVYCTSREGGAFGAGPQTLWEVPVDGSKPRFVARLDVRESFGISALSPDGKSSLHTFGDVRGAAFVSLDYTDGMTRLLSSQPKSAAPSSTARPRR